MLLSKEKSGLMNGAERILEIIFFQTLHTVFYNVKRAVIELKNKNFKVSSKKMM